MPPNRAAALATDRYRTTLVAVRDRGAAASVALFGDLLDLDHGRTNLARSLSAFDKRGAALIAATGEQAADLAAAYLATYLAAGGLDAIGAATPVAVGAVDLGPVRAGLLYRLGQGAGRAAAYDLAAAVTLRVARSAVMGAANATASSGLVGEPGITGWRRVTSPTCCQRCALLTGTTYDAGVTFVERHPADRCTPEPVLAGRPERITRKAPTVVAP